MVSLSNTFAFSFSFGTPFMVNEIPCNKATMCINNGSKLYTRKKALKSLSLEIHEDVRSEYEDPELCVAYTSPLYNYLLEEEKSYMPSPDYLEKVQHGVTVRMREKLVDWLIDISKPYRLVRPNENPPINFPKGHRLVGVYEGNTIFLVVSYVDRFLSKYPVNINKLQLLIVSAMLLASKYEEINPIPVEDLCYWTNNSYSKDEFLKMEGELLKALNNEVGNPTIGNFLWLLIGIASNEERSYHFFEVWGFYVAEHCLLEYSCIKFLPSLVAASIIFFVCFIDDPKQNPWSLSLEQRSGYKPSHLKECVLVIHSAVRQRLPHDQRFKFTARLRTLTSIPDAYFEDLC